jgi:hypothetical protein
MLIDYEIRVRTEPGEKIVTGKKTLFVNGHYEVILGVRKSKKKGATIQKLIQDLNLIELTIVPNDTKRIYGSGLYAQISDNQRDIYRLTSGRLGWSPEFTSELTKRVVSIVEGK